VAGGDEEGGARFLDVGRVPHAGRVDHRSDAGHLGGCVLASLLSVTSRRAEARVEASDYRWLSPGQAADRLGLSVRDVYRLIDKGELPGYRIAGTLRLLAPEVEEYLGRDR
jgi:excisionase family DNA binding protein